MGSGTVLVEGAALGYSAYGFEVNPAALTIAKLYEICTLDINTRKYILRKTDKFISKLFQYDMPLFSQPSVVTSVDNKINKLPENVSSIQDVDIRELIEALIVITDHDPYLVPPAIYLKNWIELKKSILGLPYSKNIISANLGDARNLLMKDNIIDFVITSPPYINVFNYHHNYRKAIEALGWKPLLVARSEIGSNRKYRQNRYFTVVQYCIDIALTLQELKRVCKDDAKIIMIIGRESNVQKTAFYNGNIVERIACEVIGFEVALKQERVFKNRFGQSIYEDVLNLQITKSPSKENKVIEQLAREIARQTMVEARSRVPKDKGAFLEDAIARIEEVAPSPIICVADFREPRLCDELTSTPR
jgi:hypothetical protein